MPSPCALAQKPSRLLFICWPSVHPARPGLRHIFSVSLLWSMPNPQRKFHRSRLYSPSGRPAQSHYLWWPLCLRLWRMGHVIVILELLLHSQAPAPTRILGKPLRCEEWMKVQRHTSRKRQDRCLAQGSLCWVSPLVIWEGSAHPESWTCSFLSCTVSLT